MSSPKRQSHARLCFTALLVVGIGFMLIGMFLAVLPYTQLDHVLSPEEFTDKAKRAATLAMLKRAGGITWLLWSLAGLVLAVLSLLRLRSEHDVSPSLPAEQADSSEPQSDHR